MGNLSVIEPGTLAGRIVRLEPMTLQHIDPLTEIGLDPALWQWTLSEVDSAGAMEAYVREALADKLAGVSFPFVTVDQASEQVIGSTRFGNLTPAHRRVEIGWTWIARPWQRTAANTEAKYLMFRYAFETLGYYRVEIKTDALNAKSRAAIERLGASYEGTLRRHMVCASGRVRDTVYYSVLDHEWPGVKAALEAKLARG